MKLTEKDREGILEQNRVSGQVSQVTAHGIENGLEIQEVKDFKKIATLKEKPKVTTEKEKND